MLKTNPYFYSLTGLRAVAAWLVFIHHFPGPFAHSIWGKSFATEAHIGVSIFFTLSGFLIANRYAFKPEGLKLGRYLINRLAKVYPLYFLITTITFLRLKVGGWDLYLYNVTLLRGFFDDLKFTGVAQGWTLTVEECFYLMAPLIFVSILKNRIWMLIWPISFLVLGLLYSLLPVSFHPNGLINTTSFIIQNTIFGRLFEFIAGVGLAWFWNDRKDKAYKNNFSYTYLGLFLFSIVYYAISSFQTEQFDFGQEHPWGMVLNNVFLPVSTSILIYGLISERTLISRLLSTRIMWWLGLASYAFYLIHMGIFHDAIVTFITWNWWIRFVLLNGIAVFIFLLVEYPIQQLIKDYNQEISFLKNAKNALLKAYKLLSS